MNITNIQKTIEILERVKAQELKDQRRYFNMRALQISFTEGYKQDEQELIEAQGQASMTGWISISEEFKGDGGKSKDGDISYHQEVYERAIAKWMGFHDCNFVKLFAGEQDIGIRFPKYPWVPMFAPRKVSNRPFFYQNPWDKITTDEVIQVLRDIIRLGESEFVFSLIHRLYESRNFFYLTRANSFLRNLYQSYSTRV